MKALRTVVYTSLSVIGLSAVTFATTASALAPPSQPINAARRAMKAQFDSPDPDCKFCSDATFLFAAQDALDVCPAHLEVLQDRLDSATTDGAVDTAWGYFCTSTCLTAIRRIDEDHSCCMGDHETMANNIKFACARAASSRYKGAELSNLKKLDCYQTNEIDCAATTRKCVWDGAQCYFNGDNTTLNNACSETNWEYFMKFPAGGIYSPQAHAQLAGTFATFCTSINNNYCYAQAGIVAYRFGGDLSQGDVSNLICSSTNSNEAAVQRSRLCMRSNSNRMAEAIRRDALQTYAHTCTGTDEECLAPVSAAFTRAGNFEAASVSICRKDGSGAYCTTKGNTLIAQANMQCVRDSLSNRTCAAGCDATSISALNTLGCCAATYGTAGFFDIRGTPISTLGRSHYDVGLGMVNRSREGATGLPTGRRLALIDNVYGTMRNDAVARVAVDDFTGVRRCAANGASAEQCPFTSATRKYEVDLLLSYPALNTCGLTNYVQWAFAADVGGAAGFSTAQVTSVTIRASTTNTVRILGVNYPATVVTIAVRGESDADNQLTDDVVVAINRASKLALPSAGPEVALWCPKAFGKSYMPIFKRITAVPATGDSPLSAAAEEDLKHRDEESPQQQNGAVGISAVSGAVAVAAAAIIAFIV